MPQPSACPPSTDEKIKKELEINLGKAVKSIPAYAFISLPNKHLHSHASTLVNRYVEKADFVAIVAPGCLHADRRDPETNLRTKTCYRTYRNRGWCVLEMFASYLSREKTHPTLVITSAEGVPEWISTLEAQKLAVGLCDFTCCERNHIFGDRIVPCDRDITSKILLKLGRSKVEHMYKCDDLRIGRIYYSGMFFKSSESLTFSSVSSISTDNKLKQNQVYNGGCEALSRHIINANRR